MTPLSSLPFLNTTPLFGCTKRKKQELKRENVINILETEHGLSVQPGKQFEDTILSGNNVVVAIAPGRSTQRISGNDLYEVEKAIENDIGGEYRLNLNG